MPAAAAGFELGTGSLSPCSQNDSLAWPAFLGEAFPLQFGWIVALSRVQGGLTDSGMFEGQGRCEVPSAASVSLWSPCIDTL